MLLMGVVHLEETVRLLMKIGKWEKRVPILTTKQNYATIFKILEPVNMGTDVNSNIKLEK
jgi:hypothetical protein